MTALATKILCEYDTRMDYVRAELIRADELKKQADYAHAYDELAKAHGELLKCLFDLACLKTGCL